MFLVAKTVRFVMVRQHEVLIAVNGELLPGNQWRVHVTAHCNKYHFSFGSIGERRGQPAVDWPVCIAIDDNSKNVAVADLMNGVQLFSTEGRYVRDIGRPVTRGVHGVRSNPPLPQAPKVRILILDIQVDECGRLRWSVPIYMNVGYVFDSRFSE